MNPDTCGRGDSIRIRICVDAETFKSGKKSLRIQKYHTYMHFSLMEKKTKNVL